MECGIRELEPNEIESALAMVWAVFLRYEAPDYAPEGVREFDSTIHSAGFVSRLRLYGAFIAGKLAGVIATRSAGSHIALFFVDGAYHRQGIGRKLFQAVLPECKSGRMTVNSSPYAVPFYQKLGFIATGGEQVVNGLRFTPMEYRA